MEIVTKRAGTELFSKAMKVHNGLSSSELSGKRRRSLPPDLEEILGRRSIQYRTVLARLCGSVNAGILLSQAIYWSTVTKHEGGWFYKTIPEWQIETYLSERQQTSARKILKKFLFWSEKRMGTNGKLYFRISYPELLSAIRDMNQQWGTSEPQKREQTNRKVRIRQIAESSSREIAKPYKEAENTSQTTSQIPPTPLYRNVESAEFPSEEYELLERFQLRLKSDMLTASFRSGNLENDYDQYFRDTWFSLAENGVIYVDGINRGKSEAGLRKHYRRLKETFLIVSGRKIEFQMRPVESEKPRDVRTTA
jgi:hypothetical protein